MDGDFSSIENTGGQVISILHNRNLSNGLKFAETRMNGEAGNALGTEGLEILLPIFK